MVYDQLEIRWDQKSREILYFLDGNQIDDQKAQALTQKNSGLPVGSTIAVGNPQFRLHIDTSPPAEQNRRKKRLVKKNIQRLEDRYQQKYRPRFWPFSALAVTDDFIWMAVRSIPRPPKSIRRFILPNGSVAPRHYRESSEIPIQGGILKINKHTGEYIRYTEENGLPEKLVCRPLSNESWELPHFLSSRGFGREVIEIKPLVNGRIRFTTRTGKQVLYNSEQGKWEDAQ